MFSSESLWAQSFPKEPFQNGECVKEHNCVFYKQNLKTSKGG